MGTISKTVTGIANDLKLVQNGKQAPTTPEGGTSRTSFTGSSDARAAGSAAPNKTLLAANGYIDQGPVLTGDTTFADSFVKEGARGAINKAVTTSSEDVTKGMGGKFCS